MMGVAKLIRELDVKPRRTIRVVLFANEEFGTSGLAGLSSPRTRPRPRVTCSASKRISAPGPVWRLSSRVNPAQLPVVDQIYRALAPLKLVRGDNEAARRRRSRRPEPSSACPSSSPDLDGTKYFDVHHTANDTLAQVDPQALRQSVAAFADERMAGRAVFRHLGTRDDGQAAASLSRSAARRQPVTGVAMAPARASAGAAVRRALARESGVSRRRQQFNTGCVALRGRLRPWVRSQARILASGALVVAVNSDNSADGGRPRAPVRARGGRGSPNSIRRESSAVMSFNACAPG